MQIECIVVVISALTATWLFVDAQIGRFQESCKFFLGPIITRLELGTCSRFFPRARKESATCVSLVFCLHYLSRLDDFRFLKVDKGRYVFSWGGRAALVCSC